MHRLILLILLTGLLTACATGYEGSPTIGSLRGQPEVLAENSTIEQSRERAKAAYRRILESNPDDIMHAEAMRRLGDLTLEDELPDTTAEEEMLLDEKRAEETIQLYTRLLKTYPSYELNDRVMYQLARAYSQSGNLQKSQQTLDQLVAKYPDSPFIVEAQFRRGEALFVEKQYEQAERAYTTVIKNDNNEKYLQPSLYKKGWALFKLNRYQAALDEFTQLLDLRVPQGSNDLSKLSAAEQERINDTLRAISLSFVYSDGIETLQNYFKQRGSRDYEELVYARLGQFYLEKERYNDAAGTYRAFLDDNPMHEQAPGFLVKTIEVYEKGKFPSLVLDSKKTFVRRFDKNSEYWKKHPIDKSPKVVEYLKQNETDLAKHYHAVAQQTGKLADYKEAEEWYKRFLVSFPRAKETPGMHFLLAESYYQSKRFADAATAYEAAAYNYGEHPQAAKSGYASLLAYQEHGKKLTDTAAEEWEVQGINNALKFEKTFPTHPQANTVLVNASEDLFKRKNYPAAMQAAERLLAKKPAATPLQRRIGWTVAAHSRYEQRDYRQAEVSYTEALKLSDLQDKNRPALTDRLASAVYKQGEQSREQGKLKDAVNHFLRVGRVAPASAIRQTAEYDAAAALITLKDWKKAIPILEAFRRNYPKNSLQGEVDTKLAAAYLSDNQPGKAATEFERIVASASDPAIKRDALLQASDLYAKSGQESRSISMLTKYVKEFPQPVDQAMEARFKLATYYAKKKDSRSAAKWHTEIISADRAAGAQRTDRSRYLAAKSSLSLATSARRTYSQVALVNPLKRNLDRKKQLMKKLLNSYGQAADYQVAEVATEATYLSGSVYQDFSKALMKSQRPAGLDAEAIEEYELLLEEQAIPFEDKSIEVHEINVRRIRDGVYDDWVRKSMTDLKKLMPARYNKQERDGGVVTRIH